MHLKSILNHVYPLESFVHKRERLVEAAGHTTEFEVNIEPRANGRPLCSGYGKKRPGCPGNAASSISCRTPWHTSRRSA